MRNRLLGLREGKGRRNELFPWGEGGWECMGVRGWGAQDVGVAVWQSASAAATFGALPSAKHFHTQSGI